ncbi:MAG TPA: methyltransferase domain-containing protein [Nitrospiraceae bacterium]
MSTSAAIRETLVSQLVACRRMLYANSWMAGIMRAVGLRSYLEDISLHEHMLADSVRLHAYHEAIRRYVMPQDDVVDVGTGTGVLAFFAAAKSPRRVYALDHSKRMLELAAAAAAANGIGCSNVIFDASTSRRFRPAEPVDVIVHDQMGVALFDEGMVETILDLRDRCMKPGGRILPAKFEFYLEPVQLVSRERIPLLQEQCVYGLAFPRPAIAPTSDYYFREIYPEDVEYLLCEPAASFAFDLSTLSREQLPSQFSTKKPVKRDGQRDGICIYFKAIFDNDISFSTGPDSAKTHWPMLFYRTPARIYRVGETLSLKVDTPDLSEHHGWSWQIDSPT